MIEKIDITHDSYKSTKNPLITNLRLEGKYLFGAFYKEKLTKENL